MDDGVDAPVVVFCHGGSWNSGSKIMYGTLASTLQKRGIVVVVINYTLHPHGLVEEMIQDIYLSLMWTKNNIEKYGGNPNKIYFMGHSAGAQLGALFILLQAMDCNDKFPEHVALRGFIGMSGPYEISDHYVHEFGRELSTYLQ